MPSVKQIVKRYPRGTRLQVWIRDFDGPLHIGTFQVCARTIRSVDFGMVWGEFVREFEATNRFRPVIVKVQEEV